MIRYGCCSPYEAKSIEHCTGNDTAGECCTASDQPGNPTGNLDQRPTAFFIFSQTEKLTTLKTELKQSTHAEQHGRFLGAYSIVH